MPFSLEFKLNCGYPSIETLGPLTLPLSRRERG
jgi:hypothetical protein